MVLLYILVHSSRRRRRTPWLDRQAMYGRAHYWRRESGQGYNEAARARMRYALVLVLVVELADEVPFILCCMPLLSVWLCVHSSTRMH